MAKILLVPPYIFIGKSEVPKAVIFPKIFIEESFPRMIFTPGPILRSLPFRNFKLPFIKYGLLDAVHNVTPGAATPPLMTVSADTPETKILSKKIITNMTLDKNLVCFFIPKE